MWILQSNIIDLMDENAVLDKKVEDLEANTNDRVAGLEAKPQKASSVIAVRYYTEWCDKKYATKFLS